jgi:hypothetical protein
MTLTAQQRQFLTDHGFILDRLPTAKHDPFITWITTPRPPFKSTSREMTPADVQKAQARVRQDFLTFENAELSDDQTRTLLTEGIRNEIKAAIDRLTGKVH